MLILKKQTTLPYLPNIIMSIFTRQSTLLYINSINKPILTNPSRFLYLFLQNINIPFLTLYFMIINQKKKLYGRIS